MTRLSTAAARREWSPACTVPRKTISLYGDGRITIHAETVEAFLALDDCLRAHNYRTRAADTGALVCRAITGGTGYSLHAYGIAADINWNSNPYGKRLVTDMPAAMVADIKAIRTGSGEYVFGWGGDYSTNKDAMHFEVRCTRADLATGIRRNTIPAAPPAEPKEWDEMATKDEIKAAVKEAIAESEVATRTDLLTLLIGVTGSKVASLRDKVTNLGDIVNKLGR